jgi:hypothetical protein
MKGEYEKKVLNHGTEEEMVSINLPLLATKI